MHLIQIRRRRFPPWLVKRLPSPSQAHLTKGLVRSKRLHTVCEEARCPNIYECFSRPTATFMILGDICTRRCGYCAVGKGTPGELDPEEPENVALASREMGLRHVVVTSVNRDDLPDGGAAHFAETIGAIRYYLPEATVEVLTPDFLGDWEAVRTVVEAGPDVYNHNTETVERLYKKVRPRARYERSLELLGRVRELDPAITTKSGIMVGLGEGEGEVLELMGDLRAVDCQVMTIGQYLPPGPKSLPLRTYVHPGTYARYRAAGEAMGFRYVFAGPFVRSSFNAEGVHQLAHAHA
ncbi:MAG: lipoyl synthase [Nitrospinota bacterium]